MELGTPLEADGPFRPRDLVVLVGGLALVLVSGHALVAAAVDPAALAGVGWLLAVRGS